MKKVFFIFLLCMSVSTGIGNSQDFITKNDGKFQKRKDSLHEKGSLKLKSRPVKFSKKDFSLNLSKRGGKKKIYLKLRNNPTKFFVKKLKKQGINLKEFIGNGVYIIEADERKINILKNSNLITGFSEIDSADKMTKNLYRRKISLHAKERGYVKIIARFYDDVGLKEAVKLVESFSGKVKSKKFSRTHKLHIYIPEDNLAKLAESDLIKYMDEIPTEPTTNNIDAGKLSNVFWDNDTGLFDDSYLLTGLNISVAVKDSSYVYDHSDFGGRIIRVDEDSRSAGAIFQKRYDMEHATHVTGTIAGAVDLSSNVGGMAENVTIYSFNYNFDGNPAVAEADFTADYVSAVTIYSAPIINNSWGRVLGWYGSSLITSNDAFGAYASDSEDIDDFIYDYFDNNTLLTYSAGNDRDDANPTNPNEHDGTLENDGNYYDLIGPLGCSKNSIVVGSIGTFISNILSSGFSNWGPTNDGRIKPDIVADGYKLVSTIFDYSASYVDDYSDNDSHPNPVHQRWSGTSMACPVVTGVCALIHQAYNGMYEEYPTADIVKALLCNYADDLGKPGPDFAYGFGLVNARACIDTIQNLDNSIGGHIVTGSIGETGDYVDYKFMVTENVNDNESIKVTLVWIDPPGNPMAEDAIVNDLDLLVTDNEGGYYSPYYLRKYPEVGENEGELNPTIAARRGINRYDTVEQVFYPDNESIKLTPGTYTVRVSGHSIPIFNQSFAVVSSIGFDNSFSFGGLKVKNPEDEWVSSTHQVRGEVLDVVVKINEYGGEFDPDDILYDYATELDNDQPDWNENWQSVSGVYVDEDCAVACGVTHSGTAYAKVIGIAFNQVSHRKNKVRFKVVYDGETIISNSYTIKNDNKYYVSNCGDDANSGIKGSPFATVQHAITMSVGTEASPAEIYVEEGTYYVDDNDTLDNESIVMKDYACLYGGYDSNWVKDISEHETILQGDGNTHVVIGDSNSILDGFTVTGGNAERGGGIYVDGKSMIISNCIIRNNQAQYGGGIYLNESASVIKDCMIKNNIVLQNGIVNSWVRGGGIYAYASPQALIENCVIESNQNHVSASRGIGGGFCSESSSGLKVINSVFKSNSLTTSLDSRGGGIYFQNDSRIDVLGCLFLNNEADEGSAIFCWKINLINSTFYGNTSSVSNKVFEMGGTVRNCVFWNNGGGEVPSAIYSCMDNDSNTGIGNIYDNPLFVDAVNGDFRLTMESPCVNGGINPEPYLNILKTDLDGNPRKLNGNVDMGAYEYRWSMTDISINSTQDITLEWESKSGITYYVDYTDAELPLYVRPVLHYKMNDNDATATVWDSIALKNGTLRTLSGGYFYNSNTEDATVTGKIDNSFYLSSKWVNCGNAGKTESDISISAWLFLEDYVDPRVIVSRDAFPIQPYKLYIATNENVYFSIYKDGSYENISPPSYSFPLNQWVHLIVTVNFIDQEAKFYVNSSCIGTTSFTKTGYSDTESNLIIGAKNTLGQGGWNGKMDDVRLYDCVLEQNVIDAIYNDGDGTETENTPEWIRVSQGIAGQTGTTSWTDDGSETSPAPDNDSVTHRFYRAVYEN